MSVRWNHKAYSKESNAKSLGSVLAGAGFLRDKKEDISLGKISLLVLGLFILVGFIYLVSALQEITTVTLNTTDSYGFGMNYTWENLTANVNPFNSSQKYLYDWRKDGNSIILINAPFDGDINHTGNVSGEQFTKDYSQYDEKIYKGSTGTTTDDPIYNATGGYDGKGAYEFPSINSDTRLTIVVSQSNLSSITDEVTVAYWVKTNEIALGNNNSMFQHYDTDQDRWQIFQRDSTNGVCIHNDINNQGENYCSSSFTFSAGVWAHIAVSIHDKDWRLYVNGVLEIEEIGAASGINDIDRTGTDNKFYLGLRRFKSGSDWAQEWNGSIDEFMVFNRSLSAEQISALYNNGTDLIVSEETRVGENWSVCGTPNDNINYGATVCSNSLIVNPPYIDEVILNSTFGTNLTSENLTANPINLTLDTSRVVYDWRKDGTSIAVLNMPFETNATCGASSDKVCDYSDDSNNGTVGSGVSYNATGGYDGKGAYEFVGSHGGITVSNNASLRLREDLSVMMWAKYNSLSNDMILFSSSGGTGDGSSSINYLYHLELLTDGKLYYFHEYNVGEDQKYNSISAASVNVSEWHHYALVRDSVHKVLRFYIDGQQLGDAVSYDYNPTDGSSASFYIGRTLTAVNHWNGTIDEFMIFNRTLSAEQIQAHYNNQTDILVEQETRVNETWQVCAVPSDNLDNGDSVCSNNLIVIAPSIDSVVLNTSTGLNGTWENLDANLINLAPSDSKIIYDWKLNDSSISVFNMPFEGGAIGFNNTVRDYIGSYNGTLGNGTVGTEPIWNSNGGYDGGAYEFDGVDDSITTPIVLNTTNIHSVSFWMKPLTTTDDNFIMGQRFDNSEQKGNWNVYFASNNLVLRYYPAGSGSSQIITSVSTISTNQWYHVVLTTNESNVYMYINGTLEANANDWNTCFGCSANTELFRIGTSATQAVWKNYNGTLDEVQLYNIELSLDQVSLLFAGNESVISHYETTAGENWSVCVIPNYYADDGETVCSNSLTILPLSLDSIVLNTSSVNNLTTENLTAYSINVTPGSAKVIYDWRENGTSIASLNIPMDGGTLCVNNTKVCDYSSDSNNGTVNSGVSYNATGGYDGNGSYEFSGSHGGITASNNTALKLRGDLSVLMWAKYNSLPRMNLIAYSGTGDDAAANYQYQLQLETNRILTYSHEYGAGTDDGSSSSTTANVDVDEWHHYAFVRDSNETTIKIYVDGVQLGSVLSYTSAPNGGTSATFYIGRDAGGDHWNGSIDEVLVFNRTLSAEQILNYYNNDTNVIAPTMTSVGENWSVCGAPNDNIYEGDVVCSNSLIVEPNIIFENVSLINESGVVVSFVDENGTVNTTGDIDVGTNATFNVTITNKTAIDKVWINIWESVIGGVVKFFGYLTNIVDYIWQIVVPVNSSFVNEEYNYTIYANTTDGFETNVSGLLDVDSLTIEFVNPTPANGSFNLNPVEVNVSSVYLTDNHYTLLDLDSNLLAWYRFENASGLFLNDSSGNENYLIADFPSNISANDTVTPYGESLWLDQAAGSVGGLSSLNNVTLRADVGWSIGFWAKPDIDLGQKEAVVSIGNGSNDLIIEIDDDEDDEAGTDQVYQVWYNAEDLEINQDISNGDLNHVMFVYDGATMHAYLDGVYKGNKTWAGINVTGPVLVGDVGSDEFNGYIDEIVVFNRTLNAGEVAAIYNATLDQYDVAFNLTTGNHTMLAYSVSGEGALKSTETREFMVDAVAPNVNLISPANTARTENTTISFRFNTTEDYELSNATLYVWNSTSGLFGTNFTNITGTTNQTNLSLGVFDVGNYTWNVLVYDFVGNSNWSQNNWSFSVIPTIDFVVLNTTSGKNDTSQNLTAYAINVTPFESNINYEWYRNWTNVLNTTGNVSVGNLLGSGNTSVMENWSVCVIPFLNGVYGDEICSNNLTIITLSIDNVTLNTSSGNNLSSENLIVSWLPEDDLVRKSVPIWSLNGENITTSYFTFDGGALDNRTKFINYGSSKQNITCYSGATTITDCDGNTDYYFNGSGRDGKGVFDFDENDDEHMRLPGAAVPTDNFTISFWMYAQTLGTDAVFMISDDNTGNFEELALFISSGGYTVHINDTSYTGGDVPTIAWTHVLITRDVSTGDFVLYENGTQEVNGTGATGSLNYSVCDMMFGLDSDAGCYGAGEDFSGQIDDIMIMDVVMTPEQVLEVYNAQSNNLTNFEINSTMTSVGQNWSVCVTPNEHNNGIGSDGAEVCSGELTIESSIIFENISVIDENNVTVSFVDENGTVNTSNTIPRGTNATFDVTITNKTAIDKVWIKVWESVIEGVVKFFSYLTNIVDDVWQIIVPTNSSFNNTEYNYTIYANTTFGEENSISATFNMGGPRIDSVILNSSSGSDSTNDNLTAYAINVTPTEVQGTKVVYDWKKNGSSIAVLNMPFESNATCGVGSNLACDYSDDGNNATVNGVIYNSSGGYDGKGAYEFDGVNDYLSVQNVENFNFSGGEGFTVMAWVKPNDLPSEEGDIITHYYSTGDNRVWALQVKNGKARFIGYSDGISASYAIGTTLVNNSDTWYHLVGRWNGANIQVYVNGVSDDPSPPSLTEIYSMTERNVRIGLSTTGSGYFNGTIDEVMIFNSSLSDEQISALYNNRTDLIVSQETSFGENWSVMATPVYDGEVGSGVLSNNLTILGENYPPSFYEAGNDSDTLLLVPFEDNSLEGLGGDIGNSSGVTFEAGMVGDGALITGSDTLTYLVNDTFNVSQGSVEMWVKPTWSAGDNDIHVFFFNDGNDLPAGAVRMRKTRSDFLQCGVRESSGSWKNAQLNINTWLAGEWQHIVCSWDDAANLVRLHINGELVDETIADFTMGSPGETVYLGSNIWGTNQADAVIDEFRISGVVRSSFNAEALISIANRQVVTVNTSIALDWNDAGDRNGDNVTYTLVVDNDADYSSPVVNVSGISVSSYTTNLSQMFADYDYYWKVIPNDGFVDGNRSAEIWYFGVDAVPPHVLNLTRSPTPAYNDDNIMFTVDITGAIDTVWYSGDWSGAMVNYTEGISNVGSNYSVTIDAGNFSNQEVISFRWYVNETGNGDIQNGELGVFTIANRDPSQPSLISPANNTVITVNSVMLNWSNVTDVDMNNGCEFGGCNINFSVYGGTDIGDVTSPEDSSLLYEGSNLSYNWTNISVGTYYWRVIVSDGINTNESEIYKIIYEAAIILNSTSGNDLTEDNLTAWPQNYDPADKVILDWKENGSSIAVLNMPYEGNLTAENGTKVRDYSDYNNNGTVVNAMWNATGGVNGSGAYSFNGVDSSISLTNTVSLVNRTITMWINNGSWLFIANVSSGNVSQTYVNGNNVSVDIPFNESDVGVYSSGSYFNGTIDEVIIWNRTLSAEQINAMYNSGNYRTDLIVSQETVLGENWNVCGVPNNGSEDGETVCSNTLTILGADTCSCPASPAAWSVNMADYCWLNSVCNITGYNLTFYGVGNFTVNATIYVNEIKNLSSGMTVWMKPDGVIWMGGV